jgi:hypothetical protein
MLLQNITCLSVGDQDVRSLMSQSGAQSKPHICRDSVNETGIYTRVLCKLWIINKRLYLLSYLVNFSFQLYKSCDLMSFSSNINQNQYVIRHVGSVVAYWSHTHGGHRIEFSSSLNFFLLFLQPSCYFTLHKELLSQCFVFSDIFNHTSLYGPIASGGGVEPTLQVCSPAMLVLPIGGNCKVRF